MGFFGSIWNGVKGLVKGITGADVLGAGTTIAGNLMGANSQKDANETNLKINQMNNEFNERMMHEQMNYNTAMLQKQQDYNTSMYNRQMSDNSAQAQRNRIEQAGLNPFMMMNGGSAGSATALGSSSASASPASAGPSGNAQGYNYNFQGIPDAIIQGKQAKIMDEQYKQWVMDNQTRAQKNLAVISNLLADTKNKDIKYKLSSVKYAYADELEQLTIQNQRQTLANKIAQEQNIIRESLLKQKELDIFDERTRIDFADRIADILFTQAKTRTEKYTLIHEVQKMYETVARTNGIKISNDVAKRSADALVEKAFVEADLAPYIYGPSNMFQAGQGIGYQRDRKWKSNNR